MFINLTLNVAGNGSGHFISGRLRVQISVVRLSSRPPANARVIT
jgi:hypothetical protein